MCQAVFGLICDFNVIVIVDYAEFYCNAFIIVIRRDSFLLTNLRSYDSGLMLQLFLKL